MSTELTMRAFELPLCEPLETAEGEVVARRGIAIRLRTGDAIGVGEATPFLGRTESYDSCWDALRDAAARIAEAEPWQLRLPDDRPAARHALQLAVMDMAARTAGRPLAGYLAGESHPRSVPVNATLGDASVQQSVAAAEDAVADGFRTIKCKVGVRSVEEDIERILAIREAIGPKPDLRLDANGSWSLEEAEHVFRALETVGIRYVEEPLVDPHPDSIASLADRSVGVALDETILGEDDPERWFEVVDVFVLKPMTLGGIDRAIELAFSARSASVSVSISTTVDAVIARTAAVHLAGALPETEAAGLATGGWFRRDLATDPAPVEDGSITIPTEPGIGTLGPWDASATGRASR